MSVRQTSRRVLQQIEENGLLSRMRFEVYKYLFKHGPLTGAEVDRDLGGQHFHKRLSELVDLGCAKEVGEKVCGVSGNTTIAWDVTAALPSSRIDTTQWSKLGEFSTLDEMVKRTRHVLVTRSMDVRIATNRKKGKRTWKVLVRECR